MLSTCLYFRCFIFFWRACRVGDLAGAGFQAVVRGCFNTLVAFNLRRFNLFLPLVDLVDFEVLPFNVFFFPLFFFFFMPRCPRDDVACVACVACVAFACAARAAAKAACSAAASARAS